MISGKQVVDSQGWRYVLQGGGRDQYGICCPGCLPDCSVCDVVLHVHVAATIWVPLEAPDPPCIVGGLDETVDVTQAAGEEGYGCAEDELCCWWGKVWIDPPENDCGFSGGWLQVMVYCRPAYCDLETGKWMSESWMVDIHLTGSVADWYPGELSGPETECPSGNVSETENEWYQNWSAEIVP